MRSSIKSALTICVFLFFAGIADVNAQTSSSSAAHPAATSSSTSSQSFTVGATNASQTTAAQLVAEQRLVKRQFVEFIARETSGQEYITAEQRVALHQRFQEERLTAQSVVE
jgi:hypothetical protein